MRICAIILLWSVGFSVSCGAEEPDALSKAKAVYKEALAKQVELVDLAFERELKGATAAGNLDEIETLKQEQERFGADRKLPTSVRMKGPALKYTKGMDAAKERLVVVYEKEIKTITRAMKIEEAKALRDELKAFVAGEPADRPAIAIVPLPVKPLPATVKPLPKPPVKPPIAPVSSPEGVAASAKVQITSASWSYWNRFGFVDDYAESVVQEAALALSKTGELTANVATFGNLNNKRGSKILELQMRAGTALIRLDLREGSVLRMTQAIPGELQAKGTRIGKTPVELISATYATKSGKIAPVDKFEACVVALEKTAVDITIPIFTDFAFGQPKVALFTFRVGETIFDLKAEEMSLIRIDE